MTLSPHRRIVFNIPNFLGAAFVVEHTDLLMTVPRRLPAFTIKQHWHARFHHDPGNRWLRGVIAELVSEMVPQSGGMAAGEAE